MLISQGANLVFRPADTGRGPFPDDWCGRVDEPGLALDCDQYVDYSRMPVSTPDQQRIEAVLDSMDLSRSALLHVGIGNSLLARRFAARCGQLDGITVSRAELAHAQGMGLPNYRPLLANKYSVALSAALGRQYDLIIDNNLASFACCGFHLMVMFSSYRVLLRPGGAVLTDQQGMEWVVGEERFRLGGDDLARLGGRLSMTVHRVNELVYAMTKR